MNPELEQLAASYAPQLQAPQLASALPRILAASEFVAQQLRVHPQRYQEYFAAGWVSRKHPPGDLQAWLEQHLQTATDEAGLMEALRRCRNQEMLRIALRDLSGLAPLDESLTDLSQLAQACCQATLVWCQQQREAQHGLPRNSAGDLIQPVILGMGKLGGGELNFSSDIDLILCYSERGETDGPKPLDTDRYFARIAQDFTRILTARTAEGFVYRVDWRLRPFGEAGPPAVSFAAMEHYYQVHGREWERYALIKARTVAGDLQLGAQLLKQLQPFVYRRYMDFSSIDALRDLKRKIDAEVRREPLAQHVKLGPGGIRELEFVVQAFQLIRGGQERSLRDPRLRKVLAYLGDAGHLDAKVVAQLDQAYVMLRRVENALQMQRDDQEHSLPDDDQDRAALLQALDYPDWDALMAELNAARACVREQFNALFESPDDDPDADPLEACIGQWFDGNDAVLASAIQALNFEAPERVQQAMTQLRDARAIRALSQGAEQRLQRLLPLLIADAADSEAPELAVERSLRLLGAIAGRSTYLSLLWESGTARQQLLRLTAASPWITDFIVQSPAVLDVLLDTRSLYQPPDKATMARELDEACAQILPADTEGMMDALRRYRQEVTLRIAAAEIVEALPLVKVSDHLTWLAEVVVAKALDLVRSQMREDHGRVLRKDGQHAEFAVIAYGKCGGLEMGYGSDLDLVFIHDCDAPEGQTDGGRRSIAAGAFLARLAQRTVHWLATQTGAGRAYEVDLRLRPSGAAGMLVSSVAGFAEYQRNNAWTWEHQALSRARAIAGDPAPAAAFTQIRAEVLCRPRDAQKLREEVLEMRAKMRANLEKKAEGQIDLKQGRGGLTDIEFLTQYLVLLHAHEQPGLIEFSDNWRQTDALVATGTLSAEDGEALIGAYRRYRTWMHTRDLQKLDHMAAPEDFSEYLEVVCRLWAHYLESVA